MNEKDFAVSLPFCGIERLLPEQERIIGALQGLL
jgi:hypothetical protein